MRAAPIRIESGAHMSATGEGRNAEAWREIAYFLCAQADGHSFLGKFGKPAHGAASKRSAAAAGAGPRMIPDGNHGDNSSLALLAA